MELSAIFIIATLVMFGLTKALFDMKRQRLAIASAAAGVLSFVGYGLAMWNII